MSLFASRAARFGAIACVTLGLGACGTSTTASSTASAQPSAAHTSRVAAQLRQALRSSPSRLVSDQSATPSAGDWPTFDYDRGRSGIGPASGLTARDLHRLKRHSVHLDGTVDSSVIELAHVTLAGHVRDVIIFTTSYGRTEALDAGTGQKLWEFAPASVQRLQGSAQITTATPVLDPDRRFVYAASPDGVVHKLSALTGHQVWQRSITNDASHEKIAGALNLDGHQVVAVTDGYVGDIPPYVGHVVTINSDTGRITHVFNTLCSNITHVLSSPAVCHESDSAIWGRPGSVIEPDGNILVTTGNADFNGHTDWGDSVLELSPELRLLHNWTPSNQQQLNSQDVDLGSTEPALFPIQGHVRLAVQGGKDGVLRLLNLNRLDGSTAPAGSRTGGELQRINAPGPTDIFSQPMIWHGLLFVTDSAGTAAYKLGSDHRLHLSWQNRTAGTSPIVSGGLLYVFDPGAGALDVYNPVNGHVDAYLPASTGHWNSPTVIGGRIFLPVGNDNDHLTTGTLEIWSAP